MSRYLGDLRPRLEQATGREVRYNWFCRMDPEVAEVYGEAAWAARRYAEDLHDVSRRGDEVGLHTHARRWEGGAWLIDHGSQSWIDDCLTTSFAAFESVFARPCRIFRMGDRFMSQGTMAHLERNGVQFDLTAEPGYPPVPALDLAEPHTGSLPDYRGVPRHPYRPSREDWRQPDPIRQDGIVAIPLSTGLGPEAPAPMSPIKRWKRGVRALVGCPLPTRSVEALNLARPPATFRAILDQLLASAETRHLAVVVRTSTAVVPEKRAAMESTVDSLLAHPRRRDLAFVTPTQGMEEFDICALN
jgi:hypothetical protein